MRKILLLGKSAKTYALAKYLSAMADIYVSFNSNAISEFATCVDFDSLDYLAIADFVQNNDISLTIPVDSEFITLDLLSIFDEKKLQIFSPVFDISELVNDKVAVKKLLYKLHAPVPRFASFDKASVAYDYLKNAKFPIIIKSNISEYATICVNEKIAKNAIDDLVLRNETILIEEYIYGKTFTVYYISDGYRALPIGNSLNYNFSLDGDGGVLTNGIGSCSPFYKLTDSHIDYLTSGIVNPILEYYEQQNKIFSGIFGLECILTADDRIFVNNIKYFISDIDIASILNLLDIDLIKVIDDCNMGIFADTYEFIPQNEQYAISAMLSSKNEGQVISGLNALDEQTIITLYNLEKNKYLEYETLKGKNIILTTVAGTISRAREKLYQEINEINFNGKTYRRDIGAVMSQNRGLLV